jgi:hypothetical protein
MKNSIDPIKNQTCDLLAVALCLDQRCEEKAFDCDVHNRGFNDASDKLGYWKFNNYVIFWTSSLTFWLRDAPTTLTFNNCTLCPHCIYVLCKQRLVPLTA